MSTLPKLSIRLHGGQTARACAEIAAHAEACGFYTAWFAENPFARGCLPAAAASALATSRLRIAAGVFNPFNRHPALMAMEIGALDELSGGRALIGIGSGIGSTVVKMGGNAEKPLVALRDTLAILRPLLRGEEADHAGRAFAAHKIRLDYQPRAGIPVFLAGRGDLTVKLAGEAADGLIISNMCTPGFAQGAVARLEESRRRAGRPAPLEVVQYMPCCVGRDGGEARARAKRAVGEMLPNYWGLAQKISFAKAGLMSGLGVGEAEVAAAVTRLRAGEDAAAVLDDRYIAGFAIAGTPQECLDGARRYAAAGVTELALTFAGPSARDEMRMLGEAAS